MPAEQHQHDDHAQDPQDHDRSQDSRGSDDQGGGQVSEVNAMPGDDTPVFPDDATAGYPLDAPDGEGPRADAEGRPQSGTAGPNNPPFDPDRTKASPAKAADTGPVPHRKDDDNHDGPAGGGA